jgi:hypothetical protein
LTLTIGTAGRLLMSKEIAEVLPLEDEEELQAANPVKNGVVRRDEAKIASTFRGNPCQSRENKKKPLAGLRHRQPTFSKKKDKSPVTFHRVREGK